MKKLSFFAFLFLFHLLSFGQNRPKYIFFMIGDGMGLNQVNLTEIYLAAQEDRNTVFPLVFSTFPHATFATSYSLSHGVTDSAAGGTALAVGKKTKNGVLSMDSTGSESYTSIAYAAKKAGMKVGITTSVSIDHATPASFYANQSSRSKYYEIGQDILKSGFDFFAGSGFLSPTKNAKKEEVPSLFPQFEKAGYQLAYGLEGYQNLKDKGKKTILMNSKGTDPESLKFAIDQQKGDLNLREITDAAITSLTKDNDKGFFLMVEGGKIDWSSHANDATTTIREVLDFNEAVKSAYAFYLKHPEETLIIVTADHETGGIAVGNGGSRLNTKLLSHQKVSLGELSKEVSALRLAGREVSWQEMKDLLSKKLGLFGSVKVSQEEEDLLFKIYEKSFVKHEDETIKSLYATDEKLAATAIQLLNKAGSIAWASNNHSAAYIPVFAIGAGAQSFSHKMENVDIPKKVAAAAGLDF
ncbi:alkaline phosphatase [Sphingobacterium psychroaquaticum]|uniref:alkaline phosphatase n=1 Tax=Sphingobacterium psychroaquaticum TaxID=561061 RepID=UPI001069C22F|nr:alkaline phosphatase [Sphingobacterium psychroaquaticum]QBQ40863.1 alkaline phosphatase [Sphingobacterium psychroaquaticum]